jgi:hypothetical protein
VNAAAFVAIAGFFPCWLFAAPIDDLVEAARNGRIEAVQALVAAGADLNAPNGQGMCALNAAAASDEPELVKWLLAHGANPNQHAKCGENECRGATPLSEAARVGSVEVAKMLLAAGADIAAEDDLATVLANLNGRVEVFKFLKAAGGREWPEHPVVHLGLPHGAKPAGTDVAADTIETPASTRLLPSKPASISRPRKRSRLAVIADAPNAAAGDLLFTELAKAPELELVERAELNRIIAEQKLSLAFATNQANYGQLGELLKADALLLISARKLGDKDVVESRLLRTNPGLVLDARYRAAPLQGMSEWAADLAARVRTFAAKSLTPKAIALSVVNFRASVGSASGRALESTLTLLLAERLVQTPGVYVMERSELDRLVREQPISEASGFWTAAWIIDGTIDLDFDGSGGIAVTAFLHPSGGGKLITLTTRGNAREIASLRENLARQIMQTIAGTTPFPEKFAAREEAERYLREARWALDCGLPRLAHRAAETAWALGDHSTESVRVRLLSAAQLLEQNHKEVRRTGWVAEERNKLLGREVSLHDRNWPRIDPLHHPDRKLEWLAPDEIFDLSFQVLETYGSVLNGLGPQDEAGLREWIAIGDKVILDAASPALLIDTSAGRIEHADRLRRWRGIWKATLEQMIDRAERVTESAMDHARRFKLLTQMAALWVDEPKDFFPAYHDLLKLKPSAHASTVRTQIRWDMRNESWMHPVLPGPGNGGQNAPAAGSRRLWKNFALELQDSNIPEDVLFGLSLQKQSDQSEESFRRVMDKLWAMRHEFALVPADLGDWFSMCGLSASRQEAFVKGTSEKKDLGAEVVAFRRKYFIFLCRESPTLIHWCASLVTDAPGGTNKMTASERAELRAEIDAHLARESTRQAAEQRLSEWGGFAHCKSLLPTFADDPSDPAQALEITRIWQPPQSSGGQPMKIPWGQNPLWAEGRVWHYCEDRSGRGGVFAIDPDTMQHTTIDLPNPESTIGLLANPRYQHPTICLVVTPKQIVLTRSEQYLAVYDRTARHWRFFEDIPATGFPVIIGDDCYFRMKTPDSSAVGGLNLTTHKMRVIASTRRVPPESPLDDPKLSIDYLTAFQDELLIRSGPKERGKSESTDHIWSPATHEWRKNPGGPSIYSWMLFPGFSSRGKVNRVHEDNGDLPLVKARTNPNHYLTGPLGRVDVRFASIGQNSERRPSNWAQCPRGIVLPFSYDSGGFWFVPQEELDEYRRRLSSNATPPKAPSPP